MSTSAYPNFRKKLREWSASEIKSKIKELSSKAPLSTRIKEKIALCEDELQRRDHPELGRGLARSNRSHLQAGDVRSVSGQFDYVTAVPDVLRCAVCLGAFQDPMTTPCGHTFCCQCVSDISTCPECRHQLGPAMLRPEASPLVRKMLGELVVFCPNRQEGCDWTGPRANIDAHIQHCETKEMPNGLMIRLKEQEHRITQLEERLERHEEMSCMLELLWNSIGSLKQCNLCCQKFVVRFVDRDWVSLACVQQDCEAFWRPAMLCPSCATFAKERFDVVTQEELESKSAASAAVERSASPELSKLGDTKRVVDAILGTIRENRGQVRFEYQSNLVNPFGYQGNLVNDPNITRIAFHGEHGSPTVCLRTSDLLECIPNQYQALLQPHGPNSFFIQQGGFGSHHLATTIKAFYEAKKLDLENQIALVMSRKEIPREEYRRVQLFFCTTCKKKRSLNIPPKHA